MTFERTGANWKLWIGPLFFCGGCSPSRWFGFRIGGKGLAFGRGKWVEYLRSCRIRTEPHHD